MEDERCPKMLYVLCGLRDGHGGVCVAREVVEARQQIVKLREQIEEQNKELELLRNGGREISDRYLTAHSISSDTPL